MFFNKLYHYKRNLFALAVVCCLIQLVIFYKQGAVATPFFNYGMYSYRISPSDQYKIYKIYANGHLLKGDEYSIQKWDKVYVPLYLYLTKDTINAEMIEVRNRLLSKLHLDGLSGENHFFETDGFTDATFSRWYAGYLSSFSGYFIHNLEIVKQNYLWNGQRLEPADSIVLFQYTR